MKNTIILFTALFFASLSARADRPSVHGMLLFGEKATYASHLPMFHGPHDYQLIMKVSLGAQSSPQVLAEYQSLKAKGEKLFTIEPEPMDLALVKSGGKSAFGAHIFHGHFERGGRDLGQVMVKVEKIVFAAKLDAAPAAGPSQFLLFGEKGDYYSSHIIAGRPSYDFIAKVAAPYLLQRSFCGRGLCPDPKKVLIADSELPLKVISNPQNLGHEIPVNGDHLGLMGPGAEVLDVIYVEIDELS